MHKLVGRVRTMFSRTVSRITSLRARAVAQRFASTKVRSGVLFTYSCGLMHNTDFERDTARDHSCQAGTTQTIGAASLIWTLRGLINL
jgi:hypothetical protein